MDGPTIRALHPDDAAALSAMAALPGFRYGTGRLPFASLAVTQGWIARLPEDAFQIVAVMEGVLVGSAGLDRRRGRQAHSALVHIGVHDAWVGRGVGAALMTALTESADRWLGITRLDLTVFVDNAPGLALYRRFGFEVEGTLRRFALRDGAYVDAHVMGRLVPSAA